MRGLGYAGVGAGVLLGGRYVLDEKIGGGVMGEVWPAADHVLERDVAVKILLPELLDDDMFAARFRRETKPSPPSGTPPPEPRPSSGTSLSLVQAGSSE